jgi:hypothetical protein
MWSLSAGGTIGAIGAQGCENQESPKGRPIRSEAISVMETAKKLGADVTVNPKGKNLNKKSAKP